MARAPKLSVSKAANAAKVEQRKALRAVGKAKKQQFTGDSFQNFIANVGIGTNNQSSFNTYGFNPITNERNLLEWMYRGSWIAAKAVDCVAEDMTRAGVEISAVLKPDQIEKMQTLMTRAGVWAKLNEAIKWSRLYGGALAVMLIDGQDWSSPLRVETITKGQFRGLLPLDRWMVDVSLNDLVTEFGPEFGQPKYYKIIQMMPEMMGQKRIHHSRVFRLEGINMPYQQRLTLNLWGASVYEPLFDRLTAFDSTTQGAAQLVFKAYLRTLSIDRLRDIVAAGGPAYQGLLRQMHAMRLFQTNEGVTLVDTKDKFEAHAYSFAGLSDVLLQFGQQLSGATGIPLVRLFGQSPAGLNSTGESDLRNYYDGVSQQQELRLRLPMDIMLRVIAASEGVKVPEGFNYTFRPLWQLTAKEKAEVADILTRTVLAARDAALVQDHTALKELREGAYENGVWSNITDEQIDEAEANPIDKSELAALTGAGLVPKPGEEKVPAGESPTSDNAMRSFAGLPVVVETQRGEMRNGTEAGQPFSVQMPADYGYIAGTLGADSEGVDVYLGPNEASPHVWVVSQRSLATQQFDEHKVMLGFDDQPAALACYLSGFSDGRGHERLGPVEYMDISAFKSWLRARTVRRVA